MFQRLKNGINSTLQNDVHYWVTGTISLSVMVIYLQTGSFTYIAFDDAKYVFNNDHVQQGITISNIKWAFTTFTFSNWHPLTWLSYMVDFSLFGLRPGLYHLENAAFHLANSILVYAFMVGLTRTPWKSGVVALLFAVHPLHVESVAWIAERKDVLSVFWGLISLVAYIQYTRNSSKVYFVLTWAALALSLLAKPMLVTLPFVFILLDCVPFKRLYFTTSSIFKIAIIEKIPFFLASLFVSVLAYKAQNASGAVSNFETVPLGIRIANGLDAIVNYILMTLVPRNLGVFYPHLLDQIPAMQTIINFVLLTVLFLVVLMISRKKPLVLIGCLWFIGTLVPVLGIVQVGGAAMADRYTYFPHIGFFIAIVWALAGNVTWGDRKAPWLSCAFAVCLVLLCVTSVRQTSYWRDTVSLFEHTARVTQPNSTVYKILGAGYGMQGDHQKAMEASKISLEMNPYDVEAYGNLGAALLELGELQEAEYAFQEAIYLAPYDPQFHVYMAIALYRQRRYEDAILRADEALRIDPEFQRASDLIERSRAAIVPITSLTPE